MTFEQIKSEMFCRELDSVAVKGKALPVRIFELLGEAGRVPEERLQLARAFQSGLASYRNQMWDQAYKVFSALHQHYPDDKPTQVYLERVAELKANPPGSKLGRRVRHEEQIRAAMTKLLEVLGGYTIPGHRGDGPDHDDLHQRHPLDLSASRFGPGPSSSRWSSWGSTRSSWSS